MSSAAGATPLTSIWTGSSSSVSWKNTAPVASQVTIPSGVAATACSAPLLDTKDRSVAPTSSSSMPSG